jgi:hypothetical protein
MPTPAAITVSGSDGARYNDLMLSPWTKALIWGVFGCLWLVVLMKPVLASGDQGPVALLPLLPGAAAIGFAFICLGRAVRSCRHWTDWEPEDEER